MRALFALLLIAAISSAETPRFKRFTTRTPMGRTQRGLMASSLAQFEAFPASGAGTSGACSTTAPTGARGEVLTFTRASNGTCTKAAAGGLATTGIANGDLVVLATDKARVEYDGAGTLGLLVEAARTNSQLRSQEIDNVVFTKNAVGAAAPVVTADQAVAPDGTTTADRVQFAATVSPQTSTVFQTACPAGATTGSLYARGVSGSGLFALILDQGGTFVCGSCSFVSGSWSRCTVSGTVSASGTVIFGNDSRTGLCGTASTSAQDAYVWGVSCENGAYATSYIPTSAAAATRAVDVDSLTLPNGLAFGSMALTFIVPWTTAASTARQLAMPQVDATNFWEPFVAGGGNTTNAFTFVASVSDTVNVADALAPNTNVRFAQYRTATPTLCGVKGSTTTCDGTGVGATITTAGGTGLVRLGRDTANSFELDGIVSRFCLDPDPSRCR